jgi:putative two-component system response regulator
MAILLIDDEPMLRQSLVDYLEDLDYETLQAGNGREGLETLRIHNDELQAVIVDLNMPVMDGYAFIREAVQENAELPVIVLSGVGVVEDALKAMRLGAWDFITKPITNMGILDHTLEKAFQKARLIKENKAYQEGLEHLVRERTAELEQTRRQIMQRLCRAAEFKDNETGRHVIRVGEISALIAQAMGLPEKTVEMVRECAPLHDLGKIGIPDNILLKPGKLDEAEWEVMKKHTIYGCIILGPLEEMEAACKVCEALRYGGNADTDDCELVWLARTLAQLHHERWDGSGYPFGLKGEQIPVEARIVALVDVFDALISERPYKPSFSMEKTASIIREERGRHFDPAIVDVFFDHLEEIKTIAERWKD